MSTASETTSPTLSAFHTLSNTLLTSIGIDADVYTEYLSGLLEEEQDRDSIEELLASACMNDDADIAMICSQLMDAWKEDKGKQCDEKAPDHIVEDTFKVIKSEKKDVFITEADFRARNRAIQMYGDEEEVIMDDEGNVSYEDRTEAVHRLGPGGINRSIRDVELAKRSKEEEKKRAEQSRQADLLKEKKKRESEKEKRRTQKREKKRW